MVIEATCFHGQLEPAPYKIESSDRIAAASPNERGSSFVLSRRVYFFIYEEITLK